MANGKRQEEAAPYWLDQPVPATWPWKRIRFVPDLVKIQWNSLIGYGRFRDLKNPRTLNDKIQWLKLYWRDERMTRCADKYRARSYVAEKAGPEFLNELYGVYEKAADIDFDRLPRTFVLKTNHASGGNVFCRDRDRLDRAAVRDYLDRYLRYDHYVRSREWCYKNIPRRILAEEFLEEDGQPPADYKFYCFNGEPQYLTVDAGRFGEHRINCYDPDWKALPFRQRYANTDEPLPRPAALPAMLGCARRLSAEFPFVRIDLYDFRGRVRFGEMTFYPGSGTIPYLPASYDEYWGSLLRLTAGNSAG